MRRFFPGSPQWTMADAISISSLLGIKSTAAPPTAGSKPDVTHSPELTSGGGLPLPPQLRLIEAH